ncbi:T9SS type A sorting domain-containing protein [Hymenobacter gummosus]|uniref:T9SS type A sorting domain-containing protein n=1 Tax=Hymenobacter gummosus TaxID=1776032 RepID=A0A431U7X7_9BACT|nr:T9SS type A sorting domain-containing protein [Hymenobacter gummosus]RTQ53339.1 T9SS type A sorting domain-containing protein [Hymenobacter gummosus]
MRHYLLYVALLSAPGLAAAQTVQPAGAPTTPVGWTSPISASNSFSTAHPLDLNGDGTLDVAFANVYNAPTGGGSATLRSFSLATLHLNVEVAADSAEFDSAKRFQAGQLIRHGIRWGGSSYLDYEVTGNGGTGGRGFFRDGVPGFVVARMAVGGTWQYWWIFVESRSNGNRRVGYYGVSAGLPLRTMASAHLPGLQAYPNPTASGWRVQTTYRGPYQLFDATGRVVAVGHISGPETVLPANSLKSGLYRLQLGQSGGLALRKE